MIKLFDTWIDEKRIIGIGPLVRDTGEGHSMQVSFKVYLTEYPITITTGWFDGTYKHIDECYSAEDSCVTRVHGDLSDNIELGYPLHTGFDTENYIK